MNAGARAQMLLELVQSEMGHCDDLGKRIIAHRLLEFLDPWRNPAPAKQEKNREGKRSLTFDLEEERCDANVSEALSLAEQIEELALELPEEGEDFGMSVMEKAGDIARNIEAHNRVTDGQMTALENMLDGLQRWFDH